MSGSSQYGKGFWSAAATDEVMANGIARGMRGDLSEWPPDSMREILVEGIARGFERFLQDHADEVLHRIGIASAHLDET